MEEEDDIKGWKMDDVAEYYQIFGDFNMYDWSYACMVMEPELNRSLNKYLAGRKCVMLDIDNDTRETIVPKEFVADYMIYDDHDELVIKVSTDDDSLELQAGSLCIMSEKYKRSTNGAVIDIDGAEAVLGLTYRRYPLFNEEYLAHIEADLKSRYLGKVCVFFDITDSQLSALGDQPGYIGKVNEIKVGGEVHHLYGGGKELHAGVKIVCADVALDCDILDLCILTADEAPKVEDL